MDKQDRNAPESMGGMKGAGSRSNMGQLVTWLQNPKNAILAVAALIGALTTFWTFGSWVHDKYDSWRATTPTAEYRRLEKLEPGIQLNAFSEVMDAKPRICERAGHHKSCIFVRPLEYVQVTVNKSNQVISYAVTIRDPDFNPVFRWGDLEIVLGKTSIADAIYDVNQAMIKGYAGATGHFSYLEALGGSNAENFQEYVIGTVDAGPTAGPAFDVAELLFKTRMGDGWRDSTEAAKFIDTEVAKEFREGTPVDTFAVTAPWVEAASLEVIGADRVTVSTLKGLYATKRGERPRSLAVR